MVLWRPRICENPLPVKSNKADGPKFDILKSYADSSLTLWHGGARVF